jgi:hypothetical protein
LSRDASGRSRPATAGLAPRATLKSQCGAERLRALCCDANLIAIVKRADGAALDVGRKARAIPIHGFQVERVREQLRFLRPDGQIIPDLSANEPVHASDGVQALRSEHERRGIAIAARTGVKVIRRAGGLPRSGGRTAGPRIQKATSASP